MLFPSRYFFRLSREKNSYTNAFVAIMKDAPKSLKTNTLHQLLVLMVDPCPRQPSGWLLVCFVLLQWLMLITNCELLQYKEFIVYLIIIISTCSAAGTRLTLGLSRQAEAGRGRHVPVQRHGPDF